MIAQSTYTIPALNPLRFTIDRGKLLDAAAVQEMYGNNGPYQRYELTEDGISPRIIPGTPGVTTYYTNTNEHTPAGYITEEEVVRQAMMDKRFKKRMELIEADPDLPKPRLHGSDDARIGFIGYGGVYGPILEVMEDMAADGQKAKFMELLTLWPFPGDDVKKFVESCDKVYVVEHSAGAQLRGLVQREATGPLPGKLLSILRYDGRVITPGYLMRAVKES
jgi:2-oxoglutarate ferredoxin oxidoreductase subunit alpha